MNIQTTKEYIFNKFFKIIILIINNLIIFDNEKKNEIYLI